MAAVDGQVELRHGGSFLPGCLLARGTALALLNTCVLPELQVAGEPRGAHHQRFGAEVVSTITDR